MSCDCTCHSPDDAWPDWCSDCEAVHEADLTQVCRDELRSLWQDMADAERSRIGCTGTDMSINMGHIAHRIVRLSRHVGALPWPHVSVVLLRTGIYEMVYRDAGVDFPPIDWASVARTEASIEEWPSASRDQLPPIVGLDRGRARATSPPPSA